MARVAAHRSASPGRSGRGPSPTMRSVRGRARETSAKTRAVTAGRLKTIRATGVRVTERGPGRSHRPDVVHERHDSPNVVLDSTLRGRPAQHVTGLPCDSSTHMRPAEVERMNGDLRG